MGANKRPKLEALTTSSDRVGEQSVVELVYVMRDETGHIVDRRDPDRPAVFVFGHGQVLPQIETAIEGQTEGFLKLLSLSPSEAFGDYKESLRVLVDAAHLPEQARVGERFQVEDPEGVVRIMTLIEISDGQALLDGNHPLAGKSLEIDLRILSVRPATAEEMATGKPAIEPARVLH